MYRAWIRDTRLGTDDESTVDSWTKVIEDNGKETYSYKLFPYLVMTLYYVDQLLVL
jgi:hypothetical protein